MYYVLKVGDLYYAGLSPSKHILTVSTPAGACILTEEDMHTILPSLDSAIPYRVSLNVEPAMELADEYARQLPGMSDAEIAAYLCKMGSRATTSGALKWAKENNEAMAPAMQQIVQAISDLDVTISTPYVIELLLKDGAGNTDDYLSRVPGILSIINYKYREGSV